QEAAPGGTIVGRVVDAATLRPLPGAVVRLQPGGAEDYGPEVFAGAVAADSTGEYRFDQVPPGRYRLRISRLGYLPATLEVDLRPPAPARVSLGLEVEPVRLSPLRVTARRPPPFLRAPTQPDSNRAAAL